MMEMTFVFMKLYIIIFLITCFFLGLIAIFCMTVVINLIEKSKKINKKEEIKTKHYSKYDEDDKKIHNKRYNKYK